MRHSRVPRLLCCVCCVTGVVLRGEQGTAPEARPSTADRDRLEVGREAATHGNGGRSQGQGRRGDGRTGAGCSPGGVGVEEGLGVGEVSDGDEAGDSGVDSGQSAAYGVPRTSPARGSSEEGRLRWGVSVPAVAEPRG